MYSFSGQKVRQRRTDLNIPLPQVAVAAERSVESIRAYEAGRSFPSAEVVARMAEVLGCEPGDFYEFVDRVAA